MNVLKKSMTVLVTLVAVLTGCTDGNTDMSNSTFPASKDKFNSLAGTWELDEKFSAEEAPFISFSADGNWIGTDGCNAEGGTYEYFADGSWTAFGGLRTDVGCEGAPIPTLVTEATRIELDGKTVTFTQPQGEKTVLKHVASGWRTPLTLFPLGRWGSETDEAAFLDFEKDYTVAGFDGCNTIQGAWTNGEGNGPMIQELTTTEMECPDVDPWLARVARVQLDAGILVVFDADGTELGRLDRNGF